MALRSEGVFLVHCTARREVLRMIILDPTDGSIITEDGRSAVMKDPTGGDVPPARSFLLFSRKTAVFTRSERASQRALDGESCLR